MPETLSLSVDISRKIFRTADGGMLEAIDGINFEATGSEFVCLVGPSGCGKTTTLRIVLGLDEDFEGHVTRPPGRMAAVFQEPRLLPWRTVRDNIQLALGEGEGAGVPSLLADLNLDGMETMFPTELSLGLARRVAIARAFAVEPSLLVLDEPFVSLDEATAARTRRLLMDVWRSRQTCALMVTHNLAEAVELADRIVVLSPRPGRVRGEYRIYVPREDRNPSVVADLLRDLARLFPPE
jgi:NitT/TauT family transport system ATP-binding protein